jgi:hypothetical protein
MMKLFGGKLKTITVVKFFDYCRRKSMARTCAGQILALGMTGDKSAVPARVPTVRRGTTVELVARATRELATVARYRELIARGNGSEALERAQAEDPMYIIRAIHCPHGFFPHYIPSWYLGRT